jgi:hypothetical protein
MGKQVFSRGALVPSDENWELRIENWSVELVNSQLLRPRAIALALRVSIPNSHPRGKGRA